jgi:hypothetical protein
MKPFSLELVQDYFTLIDFPLQLGSYDIVIVMALVLKYFRFSSAFFVNREHVENYILAKQIFATRGDLEVVFIKNAVAVCFDALELNGIIYSENESLDFKLDFN